VRVVAPNATRWQALAVANKEIASELEREERARARDPENLGVEDFAKLGRAAGWSRPL